MLAKKKNSQSDKINNVRLSVKKITGTQNTKPGTRN
jgi:hypothetical protein